MNFVLEVILEIIFEMIFFIGTRHRVKKIIRYPLIFLFFTIYSFLILGLAIIGFRIITENPAMGFIILSIDLLIIIAIVLKFNEKHYHKKNAVK